MEPLFSVVTIFTASDGQIVIHSYGPYTRNQADYQRRRTIAVAESAAEEAGGKLLVAVTRILDPEQRSPFIWAKDPVK